MAMPTTHSQVPRSSFRTKASNCALFVISIICVCVMVVCGVMVVREYSLAKEYEPSNCVIMGVSADYVDKLMQCNHCGTGKEHLKEKGKNACKESHFPCLRVTVTYVDERGRNRTGLLLPDSLHANGKYSQCSFAVCKKTVRENINVVKEVESDYKKQIGHKMKCFYDTESYIKVITTKKHTKEQVIHSMVWPSVIIAICGIIFLHLETKRRGISFCGDGMTTSHPLPGAPLLKKDAAPKSNEQTVVQLQGNGKTVDCVIAHKPTHQQQDNAKKTRKLPESTVGQWDNMSSSLSSLDKIKPNKNCQYASVNETVPPPAGKLESSLSADGIKFHQIVRDGTHSPSAKKGEHLRQDSEQTNSSYGSQLNNVKGVETPV